MKFNQNQLNDISRVIGAMGVAAAAGACISISRPEQVTRPEALSLTVASIILFIVMIVVQKGK